MARLKVYHPRAVGLCQHFQTPVTKFVLSTRRCIRNCVLPKHFHECRGLVHSTGQLYGSSLWRIPHSSIKLNERKLLQYSVLVLPKQCPLVLVSWKRNIHVQDPSLGLLVLSFVLCTAFPPLLQLPLFHLHGIYVRKTLFCLYWMSGHLSWCGCGKLHPCCWQQPGTDRHLSKPQQLTALGQLVRALWAVQRQSSSKHFSEQDWCKSCKSLSFPLFMIFATQLCTVRHSVS